MGEVKKKMLGRPTAAQSAWRRGSGPIKEHYTSARQRRSSSMEEQHIVVDFLAIFSVWGAQINKNIFKNSFTGHCSSE
jgi:hypothetical protein